MVSIEISPLTDRFSTIHLVTKAALDVHDVKNELQSSVESGRRPLIQISPRESAGGAQKRGSRLPCWNLFLLFNMSARGGQREPQVALSAVFCDHNGRLHLVHYVFFVAHESH
jgi:hypothetical protein